MVLTLVFTTIEHHNHDVAQQVGAVNLAVLFREVGGVAAGHVSASLMITPYHLEGNGRGKQLDATVDERRERQLMAVDVVHHVTRIEEGIAAPIVGQLEQLLQLGCITVHIACHKDRGSLLLGVNRREGVPRGSDAIAEGHLVGLELKHLLRHDAVVVLRGWLQVVDTHGAESVVGIKEAIARGQAAASLLIGCSVWLHLDPAESFVAGFIHHGGRLSGHLLQIGTMQQGKGRIGYSFMLLSRSYASKRKQERAGSCQERKKTFVHSFWIKINSVKLHINRHIFVIK